VDRPSPTDNRETCGRGVEHPRETSILAALNLDSYSGVERTAEQFTPTQVESMSLLVEREPIAIDRLPDQLQKHLKPGAPMPLKMMAAQGMLPVSPDQQLAALYNLHNDSDDKVREAVSKTIQDMPQNIIAPTVEKMQHPGVLDWLAASRPGDDLILSSVITNRATHDNTVARLAGRVPGRLVEIIATNQVRVLGAPIIIEQIYQNPNARMATVDRLVELAMRENIELTGIPGLRDAMAAGHEKLFGDKDKREGLGEDDFASLMREEANKVNEEAAEAERFEQMTRSEQEAYLEEQKEEDDRRDSTPVFALIDKMSISEKVRYASSCGREGLSILVRDPNKLVHNAAVKSPRVQFPEVAKWSKDKGLPDNVINYICSKRDWTEKYEIKFNLVSNPKTPLPDAIKLLNYIRTSDLKKVQANRNVPGQIQRQAKTLYRKRTGA
jgi:hypothetical protein